jgi:hypothetical protein
VRAARRGARLAVAFGALAGATRNARAARGAVRTLALDRGLRARRSLCGGRAFALERAASRRAAFFFALGFPTTAFFWSRRARFHTLRAEADCLRARRASRLASFNRLRARFSSSLAMRTRCLATSAWSRARSRGSVGLVGSLPFFFIRWPARAKGTPVSHKPLRVSTHGTYPQNLCISMWTEAPRTGKRAAPPMVCVKVSAISPAARKTTRERAHSRLL